MGLVGIWTSRIQVRCGWRLSTGAVDGLQNETETYHKRQNNGDGKIKLCSLSLCMSVCLYSYDDDDDDTPRGGGGGKERSGDEKNSVAPTTAGWPLLHQVEQIGAVMHNVKMEAVASLLLLYCVRRYWIFAYAHGPYLHTYVHYTSTHWDSVRRVEPELGASRALCLWCSGYGARGNP